MSLQKTVFNQLLRQGNPNPPGRPAGPGQALPVYQDRSGASWQGAANGIGNAPSPTPITAGKGNLSNTYITSARILANWQQSDELMVREGQIMWCAREAAGIERIKAVSTQHLNMLCHRLYRVARTALETQTNMPQNIGITAQEFDDIRHEELLEYLGHEERIPRGNRILEQACKLLKIRQFKYLTWHGVAYHWNLWGAVNNLSVSTSQEARIDPKMRNIVVCNVVPAKRVNVSNIWGGRGSVEEGSRLWFVIKCAMDSEGRARHTEIVPWAQRSYEVPPFCDSTYHDQRNGAQRGHCVFFGTVTEVTGIEPAEHKRRVAVGNTGAGREAVHDAYGTLPKIVVQVRMKL